MEQSCERAQRIALTALVFTEHLDLTGWTIAVDEPEHCAT
jgi:hypothetical protein